MSTTSASATTLPSKVGARQPALLASVTDVYLTDANDKTAHFKVVASRKYGGLTLKPAGRDRGFGDSHTDRVELTFADGGYEEGDGHCWRVIDGSIGLDAAFAPENACALKQFVTQGVGDMNYEEAAAAFARIVQEYRDDEVQALAEAEEMGTGAAGISGAH